MLIIAAVGLTGRSFIYPYFNYGMDRLTAWFIRDPQRLMRTAMPVISIVETQQVQSRNAQKLNDSLHWLPGTDLRGPRYILQSGMPLLAQVKLSQAAPVFAPSHKKDRPEKESAPALTKDCLVAIYNTHTGETYNLTDGVDRLDGKHGGVVAVSRELKKVLEENYGIKTVYSDHINDAVYNLAYIESKKTVQELIKNNPKLQLILDVHRDSKKSRQQSVVQIDGQKAARVLIIVGSDARAPFPGWKDNLAFARRVTEKMDELYPGLSLGVKVYKGRFNQHLHSQSLLLEFGSTNNTTQEAVYSAQLVADVLAEVIVK